MQIVSKTALNPILDLMQKSMIPQSAKSIMNWLMLNDIIKKEVTPEKFGRAYDLTNIYENSSLYNILSDKLSRMNVNPLNLPILSLT